MKQRNMIHNKAKSFTYSANKELHTFWKKWKFLNISNMRYYLNVFLWNSLKIFTTKIYFYRKKITYVTFQFFEYLSKTIICQGLLGKVSIVLASVLSIFLYNLMLISVKQISMQFLNLKKVYNLKFLILFFLSASLLIFKLQKILHNIFYLL